MDPLLQIAEICCKDIEAELMMLTADEIKSIVQKHINETRVALVRAGRKAFEQKNNMKMR